MIGGINDRIAVIREKIETAASRAGRDPASIKLIAVSKGHGTEAISAALAAGVPDFGENYLQELATKASAFPQKPPVWHYQGTLQRRKIRDILTFSDSLLTVARIEELAEIENRADRMVTCLIEVNIAGERQKNGTMPEAIGAILEAASVLTKVRVTGLMTVPPENENPAPWFQKLRTLAEKNSLKELSMGMSVDYEIAIEEGATMVRVGTAIFGPRKLTTNEHK